ncbi:MAG: hypothetical protein CBC37_03295 [Acidimicrobiaceae bacterium TMED77]|nr:MAG: hypothetical protein CBC37_03295 [Acidimicrobiaceae bacterium TMED77]|tara:strand:- start:1458 stop:2324 length:867 start_codon:yes stop_codon:yes gene_type:complete
MTCNYLVDRNFPSDACAFDLKRDVLRIKGDDAESFLQGQLTQDVTKIKTGESTWSFLLNPDGKVSSWLRISRLEGNHFLIDVDQNAGEQTLKRLMRFKLRVECNIDLEEWDWLAIRGHGSQKYGMETNENFIAAPANWSLIEGFDLIGKSVSNPEGLTKESTQLFEFLRILNGIPAIGKELTEKTIPAETGLVERSVSFTKGCYTGQELVARLDSRGNKVPKHLRIIYSTAEIIKGDLVEVNAETVGEITSASSFEDEFVGLAYISRKIEPPLDGNISKDPITINQLP